AAELLSLITDFRTARDLGSEPDEGGSMASDLAFDNRDHRDSEIERALFEDESMLLDGILDWRGNGDAAAGKDDIKPASDAGRGQSDKAANDGADSLSGHEPDDSTPHGRSKESSQRADEDAPSDDSGADGTSPHETQRRSDRVIEYQVA